jgi:hypothetical protein
LRQGGVPNKATFQASKETDKKSILRRETDETFRLDELEQRSRWFRPSGAVLCGYGTERHCPTSTKQLC